MKSATLNNGRAKVAKKANEQAKPLPDNEVRELVLNLLMSRAEFMKTALDNEKRNLDEDCGWPENISMAMYKTMYERHPFGKRVVRVWPSESWKMAPEVYEVETQEDTPFETAYKALEVKLALNFFMKLLDELAGIGHYGVLFLGVDDGGPLDSPVFEIDNKGEKVGTQNHNVMFVRAFDESLAEIKEYETNPSNIRYGQPTMYEINFDEAQSGTTTTLGKKRVHWTRVFHYADNITTSTVWGTPRQKAVFNNLLDIRKILGGSAEMFWKGGFPGYSFETHPDAILQGDLDTESIRLEFEKYMNHLQRYIATTGLTVKSLSVQVADPSKHLDVQIEAITTVLEIPKREFIGSEVGQLATEEDKKTWKDRVMARNNLTLTPRMVRPLTQHFQMIGALPPAEVKVFWPNLNEPSGKDIAEVAEKRVNALYKYVVGGCHVVIPPREFLGMILKLDVSELEAIIKAAMESVEGDNDDDPMVIKEEQDAEREDEKADQEFQQQKELTQVKQKTKAPAS